MSYIKLVRPVNLLFIGFIFYVMRNALIQPVLYASEYEPLLSNWQYCTLALSIIFIAAAAYVINDYYDVAIDPINKPNKWYIGNTIAPNKALVLYYVLNAVGFLLAVYCAYQVHEIRLASLHLISIAVNWWYARNLKKSLVIGNIAVSFSAAFIVLMPLIFEPILFTNSDETLQEPLALILAAGISISFFAFLISFIRELIKDMEDAPGDLLAGCKSVAIVFGNRVAASGIQFLIAVLIGLIAWLQYRFLANTTVVLPIFNQVSFYLGVTVQLPAMALFIHLFWAQQLSQKQLHFYSQYVKVMMLLGVGVLFFIKYWFEHNY